MYNKQQLFFFPESYVQMSIRDWHRYFTLLTDKHLK